MSMGVRQRAPGLRLAFVTPEPERFVAFRDALVVRGFRITTFRDTWSWLRAMEGQRWLAVVLQDPGGAARETLQQGLAAEPEFPIVVVTPPDPMVERPFEVERWMRFLPEPLGAEAVEVFLEELRGLGCLDPRVEAAQARLDAMAQRHHPHCVVCWERHPFGLKVDYLATGADTVEGVFGCGASYEGYRGVLHGGVVSTLLDGAMAACVLAKGVEAYTVDLRVRFRHAVEVGLPAAIQGTWVGNEGSIHHLTAAVEQGGKVRATARAKFFEGSPDQPNQPMPGGAGVRNLLRQARQRPQ